MGFYFNNERKTVLQGSDLLDLSPKGITSPEYVRKDPDLQNLGDRIYIRHAPGHTPGSVMIFAVVAGLVHAWVGDTFLNEAYYAEWAPPGSSWNQDLIYEHMAFARDNADVIVPGHGLPFPKR
jgi:glyoxylase-like metal-dependent hydrolase (beta-lactamase superfamily II)